MSKGDKVFVGAACFLLVVAVITALLLQPEQPKFAGDEGYQEQAASYRAGGADCEPSKINSVTARERQAKTDSCAEAQEQHREAVDNLIESRRAAIAAEAGAVASAAQARIETWGAVLGLLTLLAALAAAFFAKKAADHTESSAIAARDSATEAAAATAQMRSANEIAQKTADDAYILARQNLALAQTTANETREASELDLRPWLSISVKLGSDVTIDQRGMTFMADVTVKNVGKSIAQQVWVTPKAVPIADAASAETFYAERRAEDIREGLNNLLVPNEESFGRHFLLITPEELRQTNMPNTVMPGIYVSVVYMSLKRDKILQTGRSFTMSRATPHGGAVFENTFGITPCAEAGINEFPLGGDYAA